MIIEVTGHTSNNDAQKGSQKMGGSDKFPECFWFLFCFTRSIHDLKIYDAKIKRFLE